MDVRKIIETLMIEISPSMIRILGNSHLVRALKIYEGENCNQVIACGLLFELIKYEFLISDIL